jgi:hypothetical protein
MSLSETIESAVLRALRQRCGVATVEEFARATGLGGVTVVDELRPNRNHHREDR